MPSVIQTKRASRFRRQRFLEKTPEDITAMEAHCLSHPERPATPRQLIKLYRITGNAIFLRYVNDYADPADIPLNMADAHKLIDKYITMQDETFKAVVKNDLDHLKSDPTDPI